METMHETKALTITRTFDAPVDFVWRAWTKPQQIKQWWGPNYFTTPFCTMDFRLDGRYLTCMRSPDDFDYWSTGVYKEIVPLKRIVMTDSFSDINGNVVPATHYSMSGDFPLEMQITVDFEFEEGKTKITLTHEGIPDSEKENCTKGWNQSFDKLAEFLANILV
ncbi:MAG: ATPase [Planctomycetes bacterium GWF2_42_9]|nr:MAG: ATPase [Planctomycetes bacterium GWF2_42_9]HAL44723.1 ATPase [Phycisphaerales bacterium]